MADEDSQLEIVKYYTRARKFPQLLGRMPDGTKIPGGPYTVQQLLAGIAILSFGGMTMKYWGVFGGLLNVVVLFGLAFGAIFVIGRLPMNGRNPLFAVVGLFRVLSAPRIGRYQGRQIRIRKPRQLTHKTNVYLQPLPAVDGAPVDPDAVTLRVIEVSRQRPATSDTQDTDSLPSEPKRQAPPLTGVQALLATVESDDQEKAVH